MIEKTKTITQTDDGQYLKIDLGSYEDPAGFQLRYYRIDEDDGEETGGTLPFSREEMEAIAAFVAANPRQEARA